VRFKFLAAPSQREQFYSGRSGLRNDFHVNFFAAENIDFLGEENIDFSVRENIDCASWLQNVNVFDGQKTLIFQAAFSWQDSHRHGG
jgi:hypothetical protein